MNRAFLLSKSASNGKHLWRVKKEKRSTSRLERQRNHHRYSVKFKFCRNRGEPKVMSVADSLRLLASGTKAGTFIFYEFGIWSAACHQTTRLWWQQNLNHRQVSVHRHYIFRRHFRLCIGIPRPSKLNIIGPIS